MKKYGIGTLIALVVSLSLLSRSQAYAVVPLPDVTEADGSMGIGYSFYDINGDVLTPLAYAAGSRWDRFDFRWNIIEDTQGTWNFSGHDNIVNRDLSYGINVVGILGSSAKWATSNCPQRALSPIDRTQVPGHPLWPQSLNDDLWWRACPPVNLYLPWNDPNNYWGTYVYQTVQHFKDRVHVWEIWNEPDLGQTFWSGSTAEYAQLLKVGYQAVKAADPDATVLFAGLAYWSNPDYYVQVLDEVQKLEGAADHNYYFDVMSLHLYSNIYTIRSVAEQMQANMRSRVGEHPIWLTETGVPLWDEHPSYPGVPYFYAATIDEAAAYVIEGYAEARAAGIEKFFFFRLHDEAMGESFGLIRNDKSLRPAYVAYQVAARYLRNANEFTEPTTYANNARRITALGTDLGRVDILWHVQGGDAITHTHPAILPTATLIDHQGHTQTLHAEHGYYTVTLEPATANQTPDNIYMIGGPPLLLLQHDQEPPTSTLRQPAPQLYTDALTLTWDVTDTVSGYWYEEIQRAPTPEGPWELIAGQAQTEGVTQTVVPMPPQGSNYQAWYFRSRARDKSGHWEAWPQTAEIDTDFNLTRTVVLAVSVQSERSDTASEAWPPATLTWEATNGDVVTQTQVSFAVIEESWTLVLAPPWVVTDTVPAGPHYLRIEQEQHATVRIPFTVFMGKDEQYIPISYKLRLLPGKIYLPAVMRAHP